jgi:hypothetical protein
MTEYNYITKGYKLDLETGRDIKEGYIMVAETPKLKLKLNGIERTLSVLEFQSIEEGRTAALLIKISRTDTKYAKYYCLPHKKSSVEVLEKASTDFFNDYNGLSESETAKVHYLWLALNAIRDAYLK